MGYLFTTKNFKGLELQNAYARINSLTEIKDKNKVHLHFSISLFASEQVKDSEDALGEIYNGYVTVEKSEAMDTKKAVYDHINGLMAVEDSIESQLFMNTIEC